MLGWVIGLCAQLFASLFATLGLNLQKQAHITQLQLPPDHHNKHKPYYQLPIWLLGFCSFCLGEGCAAIAMKHFNFALLACLSSVGIVFNAIFHYLFTGMPICPDYIKACSLIVIGSVLAVSSATHHSQDYTLKELLALFSRIPVLVFGISLLVIMAILFLLRTIFPGNSRLLVLLSAMMASTAVLLSKCTIHLITSSPIFPLRENPFLTSLYPWCIAACFIFFASQNVHFMNMALQATSTNAVYPMYYTCSTIMIIVNGLFLFEEYRWFTARQFCFFAAGVCTSLYGLSFLHPDEEDEGKFHHYDNIVQHDHEDSLFFQHHHDQMQLRQQQFHDNCQNHGHNCQGNNNNNNNNSGSSRGGSGSNNNSTNNNNNNNNRNLMSPNPLYSPAIQAQRQHHHNEYNTYQNTSSLGVHPNDFEYA